jgi:hypothetical protein
MPPRTKKEVRQDADASWHAWLCTRSMSRRIPVRLIGHGRGLLAEGRITRREATALGLVVTCDGKRVPVSTIAAVKRTQP